MTSFFRTALFLIAAVLFLHVLHPVHASSEFIALNIKQDFWLAQFNGQFSPTVNITSSDQLIRAGETIRLSWQSNDAQYAELDNGIGYVPVNGSMTAAPAETTTYTITVTENSEIATASTTVYVNDYLTGPTVEFSASPTTINKGASTTLSWTSHNADTVHIDRGIGELFVNGSMVVSPEHTTSYNMTAVGSKGVVSKRVKVKVLGSPIPQPPSSFGVSYNNLIPDDATVVKYDPNPHFAL